MTTELHNPLPMLRGQQVCLRPPQPRDIADRQRCGYHHEYRRMVGADDQRSGPMSEANAQAWYASTHQQPHTWIMEYQGRAIGSAFLHQVDMTNRRARYAIGIFDSTCWGVGLGTEATLLVLGYAFNTLNLHRVDLRVLSYNERAIRVYSKVGFVQEGIEREGAWIAGQWESDVCMSILEAEYRAQHGTTIS